MTETRRPDADLERDDDRSAALLREAERLREDRCPDERRRPRRRGSAFRRIRRIVLFVLFCAVLVAALFFFPRIRAALTPEISISVPDSLSELMPDDTMGYSSIDFSNAILGESRAKSDFVALEQDVTVVSRVSQALANLQLFEKSQVIRSYGTGVYTVDLSGITESDIAVDSELQVVTVTIPHATLAYVEVDVEKTEFEDTNKAIFAFGEIKLTTEQQNLLEQSVGDAMREELSTDEMLEKADEHALSGTRELFEPLVQAVAPEYIVKVIMPETTDAD